MYAFIAATTATVEGVSIATSDDSWRAVLRSVVVRLIAALPHEGGGVFSRQEGGGGGNGQSRFI